MKELNSIKATISSASPVEHPGQHSIAFANIRETKVFLFVLPLSQNPLLNFLPYKLIIKD